MACYARAQLRVEFKKSCAMYCERVSEMVKIRHDSPLIGKGSTSLIGKGSTRHSATSGRLLMRSRNENPR